MMCGSILLVHVCSPRCCRCRNIFGGWSSPSLPQHFGSIFSSIFLTPRPSIFFVTRPSIDSASPSTCRLLRSLRYRSPRRYSVGLLGMCIIGTDLSLLRTIFQVAIQVSGAANAQCPFVAFHCSDSWPLRRERCWTKD